MEVVNCPRCGKMFTKMRDPLCKECMKEEEDLFQKVREYLDENPNTSLPEVAEATGVSTKKIMRYVREGRLEASQYVGGVTCERCGKPIKLGRYCEKCIIAINTEVTAAFSKKEYDGPRMYTHGDNKKD